MDWEEETVTVIVNNKYIVNPGKIKSVNEYIDLIKYLLKGNPGKPEKADTPKQPATSKS